MVCKLSADAPKCYLTKKSVSSKSHVTRLHAHHKIRTKRNNKNDSDLKMPLWQKFNSLKLIFFIILVYVNYMSIMMFHWSFVK